jgi:hypothetical protein
MINESHIVLPVWFELDRSGAQAEVLEKTGVSIFQIGWSIFDRFGLYRRLASTMEIWSTSTQAASGRGKVRRVANSEADGEGDG